MSITPQRFEDDLNARMGVGHDQVYRVRESVDHQAWIVEQKVGRGCVEVPLSEASDAYARVRDGYALVLRTLKYPRYQCPQCRMTSSDVPIMQFAERRCWYCEDKGNPRHIYFCGYFPLCDALLNHLEQTHPKRGVTWQQEHADWNKQVSRLVDRKAHLALDSVLRDDWRRLQRVPRTYLSDHRPY